MALRTNVVRRGSRYYVRVTVPVDLQARVGKEQVWKSLGTSDPAEASRLSLSVMAAYHAEWDELRQLRHPDEDTIQEAVAGHYAAELDRDASERQHAPTAANMETLSAAAKQDVLDRAGTIRKLPPADRELALIAAGVDALVARDWIADRAGRRAIQADTIRRELARGEFSNVGWAVDQIIARQGLDVRKGSPTYRLIAERVGRATLEALARADERDRGDWAGQPRDPVVNAFGKPKVRSAPPGERIMDVFELYAAEAALKITADTINQNRKIVALFAEFVGETYPAKKIEKQQVREWKQLLMKFPVKAAEIKAFNGLSIREIVKANETVGKPVISAKTINKYLSALGALCTWMVKNGYLDNNPCEGLLLDVDRTDQKRQSFTDDAITTLFNSPLFTGCKSENEIHLPGNFICRDHRYWLPLLSMFTGATLGELAQLHTDDVREIDGRWAILIQKGTDKRLKTKNRTRLIPVHAELSRLGFLAYVQDQKGRGETRLFPSVKRDTRGHFGNLSSAFSDYLRRVGLKSQGVVFYSFRHRVADQFRRASLFDVEFKPLMGHGNSGMTGSYGGIREGDIKRLSEMMDAISYPVDLSHLYPTS